MDNLPKLSTSVKSISSTESTILTATYNKIERNIVECSKILHTVLFTEYPSLPVYFPFVGTDLDTFKRHCTLFLRQIKVMVKTASDFDNVEPILKRIAQTHYQYKVDRTTMEQLRLCFLETLRRHLTDKVFTNDVFLVWDSVTRESFEYIMQYIAILRQEALMREQEASIYRFPAAPISDTLKLNPKPKASKQGLPKGTSSTGIRTVRKSNTKIRRNSP